MRQGPPRLPQPPPINTMPPPNYAPALETTFSRSCKHRTGRSNTTRKPVNVKEQNMAELDPSAFAKLLNDRLQVVAEDRANRERLEQLMTEVGLLKLRLNFYY